MRRAARVDINQKSIIQGLRSIGASVFATHAVGKGFPDIVVGYKNINYLFEIKDGQKPLSQQKLTKDEKIFFDNWRGAVYKVTTIDDCFNIIASYESSIKPI